MCIVFVFYWFIGFGCLCVVVVGACPCTCTKELRGCWSCQSFGRCWLLIIITGIIIANYSYRYLLETFLGTLRPHNTSQVMNERITGTCMYILNIHLTRQAASLLSFHPTIFQLFIHSIHLLFEFGQFSIFNFRRRELTIEQTYSNRLGWCCVVLL